MISIPIQWNAYTWELQWAPNSIDPDAEHELCG